jgi:hypothetical protein
MSHLLDLNFVWLMVLGLLLLLVIHALIDAYRRSYDTPRARKMKSDAEVEQILRNANDALTNRPRRSGARK